MGKAKSYRFADRVVTVRNGEIEKISAATVPPRSLAPLPKKLRSQMPKVS